MDNQDNQGVVFTDRANLSPEEAARAAEIRAEMHTRIDAAEMAVVFVLEPAEGKDDRKKFTTLSTVGQAALELGDVVKFVQSCEQGLANLRDEVVAELIKEHPELLQQFQERLTQLMALITAGDEIKH